LAALNPHYAARTVIITATSARGLLREVNTDDQIHLARAAILSYNFTSARGN
jgi:hypothetical protein